MTVNKAILIGNMGKPIEVRTNQQGKRIGNFTLATSKKWKDQSGERKEKTTWHNITVFQDGLCGVLEQYTNKGSKLYIEGEIDYQEYEKDGQKKYITKVIANTVQLLDSKGSSTQSSYSSTPTPQANSFSTDELDDEVPFN